MKCLTTSCSSLGVAYIYPTENVSDLIIVGFNESLEGTLKYLCDTSILSVYLIKGTLAVQSVHPEYLLSL